MNFIEKKMLTVVLNAESAIKNAGENADGYMDTLIKILISVVLGVALLAALKVLILDKVFPELEQQIIDMFTGGSSGETGGTST